MKKWVALILGTIIYFLLSVLLDFLFYNSVNLVREIISAIIWALLLITLYALKKIKRK